MASSLPLFSVSLAFDLVEEVVGVIEEIFRVVGPLVVDAGVVVDAEESPLVLFDAPASREKHLTAALLDSIT